MSDIAAQIEVTVEAPAAQLVSIFYDPDRPFAGTTFDDLPDNASDRFTASDLFAVTLLDMRFRPRAVRALLEADAGRLNRELARIPSDVDLWEASDQELAPAYDLYKVLRAGGSLTGVGPTTASKLLARKRPRLIPIVDSVIRRALRIERDSWTELRAALRAPGLVDRVEAMRPADLPHPVSTLRLLDTAVWMRYSEGRQARAARELVGN